MYKKISVGVALIMAMILVGCQAPEQPSEQKLPQVINASYVSLPLNVPSIVAKRQQMFEQAFAQDGIDFKYHNLVAGPEQTEALAAGSLDFASVLGGTSALLARAQGVDLKVIANYSMSPQGFGLIVPQNSSIQTLADLKGKKVATAKGTIAHQLLVAALDKAGLTDKDVDFLHMSLPDAAAAVQSGQLDGAVVGEPLLSKAIASGNARLLTDGQGLINAQIVVAVRSEFAAKYPELVRRYLVTQQAAVDYVTEHQEQALAMTAEENNMDIEEVKAIFPKYDFSLDLDDKAIEEMKKTTEFLKETGLMKADVDTEKLIQDMVDTSFLP
ncbi:MAG: aliphatic sulfonate ABC transporter substrate-binding protein [Firmicutes bacterium]|nr:aliphatic sulfonate ABC transporter substrate-binding protein [Bacillota bacterium]